MRVAIIGANDQTTNEKQTQFAYELGKWLMDNDYTIINGGMGGTMEACARGARTSNNFETHRMIAILPLTDYRGGNPFSGIKISTHLGLARNRLILVNADMVVAIGGGAGTLNEITIAWELGLPIAAFSGSGGWSEKLAGEQIDSRRTDRVTGVKTLTEFITWITNQSEI
jgi:uncharacterized protein (TIGR00725 family)